MADSGDTFDHTPSVAPRSFEATVALIDTIQKSRGGKIDDEAILAVADMAGVSPDEVRIAVKLKSDQSKDGFVDRVRSNFLSLAPETRLYVGLAILGAFTGVAMLLESAASAVDVLFLGLFSLGKTSQIFGLAKVLLISGAVFPVAVSRSQKAAAIAGGAFAGMAFATQLIFSALFVHMTVGDPYILPAVVIAGTFGSWLVNEVVRKNRDKFGLKDPATERKLLLQQLVEIQEKLRGGEQEVTFLSVDIVGSTKMKEQADSLSVEYTFGEYHQFVERNVRRFAGRIHSTAGDGVTAAFESPQQAFGAARSLQSSLMEFNMYKNRIGQTITVRCGIHTGKVVAPDASDIKSLNFAQVIDIAAHVQKACPPGGVAITEHAACLIPGGNDTIGGERVQFDDAFCLIWQPRVKPASLMPQATP